MEKHHRRHHHTDSLARERKRLRRMRVIFALFSAVLLLSLLLSQYLSG